MPHSMPAASATERQSLSLLPAAADRASWEQIAHRCGPAIVAQLVELAWQTVHTPLPAITVSHYRTYMRSGDRKDFEQAIVARRSALSLLTAAAALAGEAFVEPLEDVIWSTCEETTWVSPSTARGAIVPDATVLCLRSATTGLQLATTLQVMGGQLNEVVRARVRAELSARVIDPFLKGTHWWLDPPPGYRINNWTAVCCAGALASALLTDAPARRQTHALIDRALPALQRYIESFDRDGGCEEGASYWVFGMDYFVFAAELILQHSRGSVNLFEHPQMQAIARFPLHVSIGPLAWITSSDCRQVPRWSPGALAMLDRRLEIGPLSALARAHGGDVVFMAGEGTLLHNLAWWPEPQIGYADDASLPPTAEPNVAAHTWFRDLQMMISRVEPRRSGGLVVTVQGGHNGQSHNHNDVGHVALYFEHEPLLVDLGSPRYDRDYFSPRRCSYLVASSLGHSVPVVNGQPQTRGLQHKATVLGRTHDADADVLRLDLTAAYPSAPTTLRLVRTVTVRRSPLPGSVHLLDEWEGERSAGKENPPPSPPSFQSVLVTAGSVAIGNNGTVTINGVAAGAVIRFCPQRVAVTLDRRDDVQLCDGKAVVTRICFTPVAPWLDRVELEIVPTHRGPAGRASSS